MKATLKAHLQSWVGRLEALKDTGRDRHSDFDPYSDYDFFLECGFHAIRPPSPLSSGQAFHGHLATCSTAIRPGSRSAATQGGHC